MKSISVQLDNVPGALAGMGEALGAAGVSIEGGGIWNVEGKAVGHFLFSDGNAARDALEKAGIDVLGVYPVHVQKLDQERPGQLGAICRLMAEAGVNIQAMYSDHANRLILVVDDHERGQSVSRKWMTDSELQAHRFT